jgi:hypothetical protein
MLGAIAIPTQFAEEQTDGAATQFREILVHSGQRRPEVSGLRDVVESDDADVTRDIQSGHAQVGVADLVEEAAVRSRASSW